VATLNDQRVIRFSWDDKRVITAPAMENSGKNEIDLVDWSARKVLWRLQGTTDLINQPVTAFAQPNGSAIMVAVATEPSATFDQLWLVKGDGSATLLYSGLFYPAFTSGF
jgi:hypothetical protein